MSDLLEEYDIVRVKANPDSEEFPLLGIVVDRDFDSYLIELPSVSSVWATFKWIQLDCIRPTKKTIIKLYQKFWPLALPIMIHNALVKRPRRSWLEGR